VHLAERLWGNSDGLVGQTRVTRGGVFNRLYSHGRTREQHLEEERRQRCAWLLASFLSCTS